MSTRTSTYSARSGPQSMQEIFFHDGTSSTQNLASGYDLTGSYSVTYAANLPDWKGRIARRESATTLMYGNRVNVGTFRDDEIVIEYHRTDIPNWRAKRTLRGPLSLVDSEVSTGGAGGLTFDDADARAVTYFGKRILSEQRSMQSLVSFGEIGETIRMIRNPLKTLFSSLPNYLNSAKKRARKERTKKRKNKVIQDTWLEYSFGWAPLVNDIYGACQALARLNTYAPPYKVVTGRGRAETSDTVTTQVARTDYNFGWRKTCVLKDSSQVRYKGCVAIAAADTFTTDQLGLSLRDIVPSLWELIPYSFLVDYFTNVGTIIEANSIRRSDLRWVERGWRKDLTRVHKPLSDFYQKGGGAYVVDSIDQQLAGDLAINVGEVRREEYIGGFVPPLSFQIPGLGLRWLNIAALATSSRQASQVAARIG